MKITINGATVEPLEGETLIETARRTGIDLPSLCYARGAKHQSSCMVCAVINAATGQAIPSCTTYPVDGMIIETDSAEAKLVRALSLELLLSDHRADCAAPCTMVCPKGLDVERMLGYYDGGQVSQARALIAAAFHLPEIGCADCKAPCERACRRGTVDSAVSIRSIISEIVALPEGNEAADRQDSPPAAAGMYQSRLGRFTARESAKLKASIDTASRCLHCACAGQDGCKLRLYATQAGIKRSRYESSSVAPAMDRQFVGGRLWFEPAKCVRCGLCVYNTSNGFAFRDRGFGMQVVLPDENRCNVGEDISTLCPTGALYTK